MGSERFYFRPKFELNPLEICDCPALCRRVDGIADWRWSIRNRRELHQFVESLGEEAEEWLLALYVSVDLNLLAVETVAKGTVGSVEVPFGAILRRGVLLGAQGFFLAHNHPSGDPRPSKADIAATRRLVEIAEAMDLPLLEHVIVANGEMHSVGFW